MNESLNDIHIGDWLAITTNDRNNPVLRQVISVTSGLVKTSEYTFLKDGTAFFSRFRIATARRASLNEFENGEQRPETEEYALARYLKSVSEREWARLGGTQLKKIKADLEKLQVEKKLAIMECP